MLDRIENLFAWVEKERRRLEQGKPSEFGYPGSAFTPHHSDYHEVYLLWDFVGGVARLQRDLQDYFDFELGKSFEQILLTPSKKEYEQIDLVSFSIDWQDFPISFRCGYDRKTNKLIFSDKIDYTLGSWEEEE